MGHADPMHQHVGTGSHTGHSSYGITIVTPNIDNTCPPLLARVSTDSQVTMAIPGWMHIPASQLPPPLSEYLHPGNIMGGAMAIAEFKRETVVNGDYVCLHVVLSTCGFRITC